MLSIHLHNIRFFAHHGIFEEEKITGNDFEVNVTVNYSPGKLPVKHLKDTIDYIAVHELVRKRMAQPTALLETIATEIAQQVLLEFPLAQEVSIAIKKMHPPVAGFMGSVGVSFELKRE